MDTFETLGKTLKPHAVLTSMGLSSERALEIVNNRNLTFTPKYMSQTEAFRAQLKAIAESVDVSINSYLNMLTTDKIAEVIEQHKHIEWDSPKENCKMELTGISKMVSCFVLEFKNHIVFDNKKPAYRLHDLEIQDVLSLLATVENCLTQTSNVLLNS